MAMYQRKSGPFVSKVNLMKLFAMSSTLIYRTMSVDGDLEASLMELTGISGVRRT
jgi:hypothetical protein